MSKLKELLNNPVSSQVLSAVTVLALLLAGVKLYSLKAEPSDPKASSVMIGNKSMTHGGTGIILESSSSRSIILTNDHVCKAVKSGGVVRSQKGDFQVASIIESELSDLCMVEVLADLGVQTNISPKAPQAYDLATVSGHPALMPNVLSYGHVSGRRIIDVMTGIRPCTDEEKSGPLGLACLFFGGLPVVRSFESVLVTATIMPGSSGSGVYNKNNELMGVVFAGSSGFGYAWTVPYEQLLNFITREHKDLKVQTINQELDLAKKEDESKKIKETLQLCNDQTDATILKYCDILKRDSMWRQ